MDMTITNRIDAITDIPAAQRRPDPPAPKAVKIELTGRCNYRCGFCALRLRESQPTADMDPALFYRITREMREAGVEEIGLFYIGEPFLAPKSLVSAIRYLKADLAMPYVFLTTNGSCANPPVVEAAMQAGLDSLKFSINASDDEQFRAVMQVQPRLYHQALQNLQAARKIRDAGNYACGLYASSIRYDGEQQERMEALLRTDVWPYVDEHYWLPLYSMASLTVEREAELGYRPIAGNQGRIGALREPLPCWSAFTEGHVTSTGMLTACCFDADGRFAMGDLNTTSFADAWHSAAFQSLRAAHLARTVEGTPCEGCIAYR
jgi:pyruvate-formate lyase-activating enzyme